MYIVIISLGIVKAPRYFDGLKQKQIEPFSAKQKATNG